jgi:hypothetical protein
MLRGGCTNSRSSCVVKTDSVNDGMKLYAQHGGIYVSTLVLNMHIYATFPSANRKVHVHPRGSGSHILHDIRVSTHCNYRLLLSLCRYRTVQDAAYIRPRTMFFDDGLRARCLLVQLSPLMLYHRTLALLQVVLYCFTRLPPRRRKRSVCIIMLRLPRIRKVVFLSPLLAVPFFLSSSLSSSYISRLSTPSLKAS